MTPDPKNLKISRDEVNSFWDEISKKPKGDKTPYNGGDPADNDDLKDEGTKPPPKKQ